MADTRAGALQVVDPLSTRIARNYTPYGFIYDQIVDRVPVPTLTGKHLVFDDNYWFQTPAPTVGADRDVAKEIEFKFSTESYECQKHQLKISMTEVEIKQASTTGILDLRADSARYLKNHFLKAKEIRLAALLNTIDAGGELDNSMDATPSNNWNVDNATIEADIASGVTAVYDAIGRRPTHIILPFKLAYAVALQADIREIVKYTVPGDRLLIGGDRALPMTLHGLKVVIPEGAQTDTANEGGTASRSEIWGDHARLVTVGDSGPREPGTVKAFSYQPETITTWRENDPDVDYMRIHEWLDEKVVAPKSAYILKNLLAG